jgi:hypothetical protein
MMIIAHEQIINDKTLYNVSKRTSKNAMTYQDRRMPLISVTEMHLTIV